MKRQLAVFIMLSCLAAPASADELRDLCPERPGLGTPACIVDRGHVVVEAGLADWTLRRDRATRTDTFTAGDLLVRYGITETAEVQVGWAAFGHERVRDRIAGGVERSTGTGDVRLGLKQSLASPDGSGAALALLPYVTLPTGNDAIGAGDWSAGLVVPASVELPGGFDLAMTPEINAAVDEDRHGRHLAYGATVGLGVPLTAAVTTTAELSVKRDNDPTGHETRALAGFSLAWQTGENTQLDAGANLGLNRDTDDVELYLGVVRRF